MKVKVSEATNAALDWMVAKAMGYKPRAFTEKDCGQSAVRPLTRWCGVDVTPGGHTIYSPSTNPAQGHPIIEREGIQLSGFPPKWEARTYWSKSVGGGPKRYWAMPGPTSLIAGLRCFVASELGDEVEVPDELVAA